MSISSRITAMEQHITNAYDGLEDLGVDLTNVDKNIDNIASKLQDVWNDYPKVTATDVEEASINGTKKGRMEIDLKGQTSQATLLGTNQFQSIPTQTIAGVTLTYNQDGSYTLNGTATISANFMIENVKLVAGEYTLQAKYDGSMPNNANPRVQLYSPSTSTIVQINNNASSSSVSTTNLAEDINDFQLRIRIENRFNYNNVKLYPLLVKGTYTSSTIPDFEKYCGGIPSPNPDFPQPIKNVTGNANVKIQNKNLFVAQKIVEDSNNQDVYLTQDGFIHFATGGNAIIIKPSFAIKSSTAYTFKFIIKSAVTTTNSFRFIMVYTDGTTQYSQSVSRTDTNEFEMVFSTNGSKTLDFIRNQWTSGKEAFFKIDGSMILEGSYTAETIPEYVPHQEQNYPFTFAQSQRAMQGTTLEDDGIHNTWKKVVFDGTENWRWNDTKGGAYCDSFRNIIYSQAKSYANAVCNYFILNKNQTWVNNHFGFNDTGTTIWFLNTSKFSSLTEWTSWLAEQYANGTPVIIEYELAEEETISYQGVQQAQYNAIKQAKSYDDITYITSTSDELGFKMDVESLSNGASSSNTRTLALGSLDKGSLERGSLNNIKEVDTEDTEDETSVESEE